MRNLTRRKFIGLGALAAPALLGADTCLVEPTWLRVTEVAVNPAGALRVLHFTDLHYKGDEAYAAEVVAKINALKPAFVCFTGDLVENKTFALTALDFIRQIKAPVFGSPGNHDYWCGASFADYESAFAATGGGWLSDRDVVLEEYGIELIGLGKEGRRELGEQKTARRIVLVHYPAHVELFGGRRFDLILAGHSHGGQVRLPFYGPLVVPWGVGKYDYGYYDSPAGPLYVNAGIGTYYLPWRFNCRPELTVLTL